MQLTCVIVIGEVEAEGRLLEVSEPQGLEAFENHTVGHHIYRRLPLAGAV